MMTRKYVCKYCGKIAGPDHKCPGMEKNREIRNAKRRQYYQKNKETLAPLMSKKWQRFRLRIIDRDDHMCQRCYIKYGIINGDELQVHHIKPRIYFPELMYDEDNVITTCKTCNVQLGLEGIDFEWEPPIVDHVNL